MLRPKLLLLSDQAPTPSLPARNLLQPPLPPTLSNINGKLLEQLPLAAYSSPEEQQIIQFADAFITVDIAQLLQTGASVSTAIQSCTFPPLQFNVLQETVDQLERGLVRQTLHFDGEFLYAHFSEGIFLVASTAESAFFIQMFQNGELKRFHFKTTSEMYCAAFDGHVACFVDRDQFISCYDVHHLSKNTIKKLSLPTNSGKVLSIAVCSAEDIILVGFDNGTLCYLSIAGDILYECNLSKLLGFSSPIEHILCQLQSNHFHVMVIAQKTPLLILSLSISNSPIARAEFSCNPLGIIQFRQLNEAIVLALLRTVDLFAIQRKPEEDALKTVHEAVFCDFPYPMARREVSLQALQLEALFCVAKHGGEAFTGQKSEDFAVFQALLREQLICARKYQLAAELGANSGFYRQLFRDSNQQRMEFDISDFKTPAVVGVAGSQFEKFISGDLDSAMDQFSAMATGEIGPSVL